MGSDFLFAKSKLPHGEIGGGDGVNGTDGEHWPVAGIPILGPKSDKIFAGKRVIVDFATRQQRIA